MYQGLKSRVHSNTGTRLKMREFVSFMRSSNVRGTKMTPKIEIAQDLPTFWDLYEDESRLVFHFVQTGSKDR